MIKKLYATILFLTILLFGIANARSESRLSLALIEELPLTKKALSIGDVLDRERSSRTLLDKYAEVSVPVGKNQQSILVSQVLLILSRAGADIAQIQVLDSHELKLKQSPQGEIGKLVGELLIADYCKGKTCSGLSMDVVEAPASIPNRANFSKVTLAKAIDYSNEEIKVHVQFQDNNGLVIASADYLVTLNQEKDVLVANRNISSEEYASIDDFTLEKRSVSVAKATLDKKEALNDLRVKISGGMASGDVLLASVLSGKFKMQKGDIVTIIAGTENFRVKTVGKVKEINNGGATVIVENIDTKKELTGKPLNDKEVEVVF